MAEQKLYVKVLGRGARMPAKSTLYAACMDVRAFISKSKPVKAFDRNNVETQLLPTKVGNKIALRIPRGYRVLMPTGLAMATDPGYQIKAHPRSGLSLKYGVNLINCEGVIDADYQKELFLPLMNNSDAVVDILNSERCAQIEIAPVIEAEVIVVDKFKDLDSDRDGGLGSTGKV